MKSLSMPPSLDNPFRRPPRSKKEAEELSDLLVGKKGKVERDDEMPDSNLLIELNEEEQELADEFENVPWTREQMEEWAANFNLDREWVRDTLFQGKNGYWTAIGNLNLSFIDDPKDLPVGIEKVKGKLELNGIFSTKDLILPKKLESLQMNNLTSLEGLKLPEGLKELMVAKLSSIEGVIFPESLRELIIGVTSATNLKLPKGLKNLLANSLLSVENLFLPEGLEALALHGIKSAKGLVLPDSIKSISLIRLASIEDLNLPDGFDGNVYLNFQSDSEKEKLRKKYPNANVY